MEPRLMDVAKNLGKCLGVNFYNDPEIIDEFEKVKDQKGFFNILITGMFKLCRSSISSVGRRDIIPIKEETMSFLLEKIEGEKQFEVFRDIVLAFMLTAAIEKNVRKQDNIRPNNNIAAIN